MTNEEIRDRAKNAGVYLWQVAEACGIHEVTLSRMMRHEITGTEREKILSAIDRLAAQKEGAV